VQSVGLLARALEMAGIATTLTSWNPVIRLANPPRATLSRLNRGATLGEPHDKDQQRRVLEATLTLLAEDAPLEIVHLDEAP
jgi:hypothetical protein